MDPIVVLMRGFVVDFFNRHDASICRELMTADYTLRVGDLVISGRDHEYIPAVQQQFDQFPGLGMTVHGLLVGDDRIALHFSEHGVSGGPGGRSACWSGIALYSSNGVQLTGCVAIEDYAARRRQLTTGVVDRIDSPMAAPWDTMSASSDPDAEALVRSWLAQPMSVPAAGVIYDDEHLVASTPHSFEVTETEVTDMFSAGSRVAFHMRQLGHTTGEPSESSPRPATLFSVGIVEVVNGTVSAGRVIRDRAGLRRANSVAPSTGDQPVTAT